MDAAATFLPLPLGPTSLSAHACFTQPTPVFEDGKSNPPTPISPPACKSYFWVHFAGTHLIPPSTLTAFLDTEFLKDPTQ